MYLLAGIAQSVELLVTDLTDRGSNPDWGDIFLTRPDRPWGPPRLLYNWYQDFFSMVKWPGRGLNHPPISTAKVKERVEIYLYSPSGPSRPVLGRNLHFNFFQVHLDKNFLMNTIKA